MRAVRSRIVAWSIQLLRLQILEQHRPQLDDLERGLAPGDDGVHTRTIRVVRAHPAVSIAVEPGSVTAGSAVPFAGDQVRERRIADIRVCRRRVRLHKLPLPPLVRVSAMGRRAYPDPAPPARLSPDGPSEYREAVRNATRGAGENRLHVSLRPGGCAAGCERSARVPGMPPGSGRRLHSPGYTTDWPPSTISSCPVMCREASLTRNSAAAA